MVDAGLEFKGSPVKEEKIQFFFRRHWTRFLYEIFFASLTTVLIGMILYMLGRLFLLVPPGFIRSFYAFFALTLTGAYIHIFFLRIINYFFNFVIVTDHRILIVRKTIFFRNDTDAIDLTKIQDITAESHGILRNYLNYGELIVILSSTMPPVVLEFVPDPHYCLEQMNRVKRDYILKRQTHRSVLDHV
jgi:hypothetical protein